MKKPGITYRQIASFLVGVCVFVIVGMTLLHIGTELFVRVVDPHIGKQYYNLLEAIGNITVFMMSAYIASVVYAKAINHR